MLARVEDVMKKQQKREAAQAAEIGRRFLKYGLVQEGGGWRGMP